MSIRNASIDDAATLTHLLQQLDYAGTETFIKQRITELLNHPGHQLLVYELEGVVVACMSIHFVPQLALQGDFAIISYFAVDESARSKGIGKLMEAHCTNLAKQKHCNRIQVHCHIRRQAAHRFYERQGYSESRKYFIKKL